MLTSDGGRMADEVEPVVAGRMGADDVLGFTLAFLLPRFDEPRPIPVFHEEIWALCCREDVQVAIAAPRGHAKSTAITFAFTLTGLMLRDFRHVLILSANEELAASFIMEIRTELHDNEALAEAFGPFDFLVEKEAEIVVRLPDGHRLRIIAKGAGQRMRGLKWDRMRPDMVLADDLEDDDIVQNESQREKFRRWFYGAVRPIVRSGGRLRLYGTIIHMDSLLERTMPAQDAPTTAHHALSTVTIRPQKGWYAAKYRAHDADFSHILWPSQFPAERLRAIRQEYSDMGMLDVYGQEYLNDPIDETTAFFRRDEFLPMSDEDRRRRKSFYVGVDLAISQDKRSARTAFVVGGVDDRRVLHIVDVRRGHWDTMEIIQELFALNNMYAQPMFRFEQENIARSILPVLEFENQNRALPVIFDTKVPSKDKMQRARAFQYRMRSGNVRFDVEAPWFAAYQEELVHFPRWKTLDQVDASAWLGTLVAEEIEAQSDREMQDEQYDVMVERDFSLGRSLVTGY